MNPPNVKLFVYVDNLKIYLKLLISSFYFIYLKQIQAVKSGKNYQDFTVIRFLKFYYEIFYEFVVSLFEGVFINTKKKKGAKFSSLYGRHLYI